MLAPHSKRSTTVFDCIFCQPQVVQRVLRGSVEVDNKVVSEIGQGLVCFIGVEANDTDADAEYIARKILNIRLWHNSDTGKTWNQSVTAIGGSILCISQFTLCGRLQGNSPDFSKAMPPQQARETYEKFLERLTKGYGVEGRVKDGVFGAMMAVSLTNDGPVTWTLDSTSR